MKSTKKIKIEKDIVNKLQLSKFFDYLFNRLDDKKFFKPKEKKPIMLENLRTLFYKLDLSQKETRILSSVFASLAKKKVDWQNLC